MIYVSNNKETQKSRQLLFEEVFKMRDVIYQEMTSRWAHPCEKTGQNNQ